MKKRVMLLVFLFAILLVSLVSAQNETLEDKAYSCLQNKVEDKCKNLQIEEQAFSLLALSYNSGIKSECVDALKEKSSNNECYPSSGCKIKDTSLALLALKYAKTDTDKIENWLISKNKTSSLEWYLEIDASTETSCSLTYDSSSKSITISEDKKISGSPGTCFELAYDSYWLKIKPECLRKNITVSCNKDFISTLLFKKTGSNVWHVSSNVESASSGGKTQHTVNSYCFSTGTDCNYEDNLWAVLALKQAGKDVTPYTHYLVAFSEDNDKYFPSSILYYLTNSEEYISEILTLQKTEGYWDIGEKGKFYDTALALLSLTESQAEGNAKSWLEENQGSDGCWNSGNVRDTAFLLWAAYPKAAAAAGVTSNICQDYDYYCVSQGECDEVNGDVLDNFACSGLEVCCDKPAKEKTCQEEGGIICPSGQVCSISTITASDTETCCLGTCSLEETECEEAGYNCRAGCLDIEETTTETCDSGDVCCKLKPEGKSYWWIYVLIILIILVVLGIIFRNKLRVLLLKFRGGVKTSGVTKTYPKFPPTAGQPSFRRMIPPLFPQSRQFQPARKPASKTDKELEETLKKLKEISK